MFIVKISDGHKTEIGEVDNEFCDSQNLSSHEVMTLVAVDSPYTESQILGTKKPQRKRWGFFYLHETKR